VEERDNIALRTRRSKKKKKKKYNLVELWASNHHADPPSRWFYKGFDLTDLWGPSGTWVLDFTKKTEEGKKSPKKFVTITWSYQGLGEAKRRQKQWRNWDNKKNRGKKGRLN